MSCHVGLVVYFDYYLIHHLGDKLLVGTQEGALLVFEISYHNQNEKRKFNCDLNLDQTKKTFSKRAITQLCVIPDLNVLLSISDGYCKMHALGTFKEIMVFKNKKVLNLQSPLCTIIV